jgi:hypothetical protein
MPGDLYDTAKVLEKTLVAARDVPVYDGVPRGTYKPKQIGIVKSGKPIGIVYSFADADPTKNRPVLWWMFYPSSSTSGYYYTPHDAANFSLSALRSQGVISVAEQIAEDKAKEDDANKEWYEKILDRIVPIGVGVIVGVAVIKGLLSRK